MEPNTALQQNLAHIGKQNHKILIKALMIAGLTLLMLIPTSLISNLVIERQQTYLLGNPAIQNNATKEPPIQSLNYQKTMRTTKYAVLVIGLTFAIFFLTELLQKRPVHPVQYTLVGFALALFYTLLLSFAEYMPFDYAYVIAALAIIVLITLYVQAHFKNWKAANVLSALLTTLYAFIWVLISLEHAALLVGSIALFIILASIMYFTRNVNWYRLELSPAQAQ